MSYLMEKIGSFLGGKLIDAAAVAAAVGLLRTGGVRDPKTLAGAIAIYVTAKREYQLHGQLAGRELDVFLQEQFDFNFDEFTATNLQTIDDYLADVPIASDILDDFIELLNNYQETSDADTDGDGIPDYLDPFPDKPAIPEGSVSIEVSNAVAYEGDTAGQSAQVTVSISSALSNDIVVSISYGGYVEIAAGSTSGSATITWDGDTIPEEDAILNLEILGFSYGGDETVVFGHGGTALIKDDDDDPQPRNGHPMDPAPIEPPRRDPLVLDMDKDGFISTTSLEDSNAYFDLTGDGIKEKVGWIEANDGILVYDKNESGKIDGIDEVFGNQTTSGFTELRQIADSNYDGIIDRKDELYSRLKVWHDKNGDGISQTDELVSLSDAGVTSINLDVVGTNINLNGNLLTEASKYTDSQGNKELAADLELEFDSRITKIDTSTIPDYTEHPDSSTLPNLRGYGIVSDSYITYNVDENFRALALEFGSDISKVANEFESFMDGWSGYTKMQTDLQTKYNLNDTPKLSDLDRKVWTYEHFMGTGSFSAGIEKKLDATARAMQSGGSDTASSGRYNTAVVHRVYDDFTDRNRAFFSLKAFYADVLSDAVYEYGLDEYVITDQEALSAKVSAYINNPDNTLQEKLYLVSQMNTLQGTFLDFNAESITSNIDDTLVKNLVTAIYNDTLNADIYNNSGIYSNNSLIVGNDTDEVIDAKATSATVLAGKGDDRIYASTGNNTYIYRTGDGADTIVDGGGTDTLNFSDMLLENVIIKAQGKDLIIAVAEDGKTYEELTNKVTIANWIDSANRIENITFADGSSPNFIELIKTQFITEGNDKIDLTNSNDTVEMLGGDDVVNALGGDDTIDVGEGNDTINAGDGNDILIGGKGDDTLYGGSGNDTYIFNLGDGSDTILDSKGNDTLKFGDGITLDMLSSKMDGDNLIISANTDDSVTIQNYTLASNKIENITLNDGTQIDITSLQSSTDGDDTLVYGNNSVTVDAKAGNDTVTTGSANDTIVGGAGNDTVNSGSGNDIITGGTGTDTLLGGLGDDTYIFNRGDGRDTIIDSYTYGYNNISSQNAGNDTIKLGAGIIKDDLLVTVVGTDIVVALKEEGKTLQELTDIITIKNGTLPNNAIENILLSDGTKLLIVDMQEATEQDDTLVFGDNSVSVDALGGNDTITSGKGNDTLYGGAGNDTLRSNDGNDALYGGDGDDILDAGRGNDTLVGDKGNDTLMGGLGNDTYIYNRGDGKDTIIDSYSYGNAGNDTLKFGEGINAEDIIAKANGNDMIIALKEDGKTFEQLSDTIILKDWLDSNKRVENFMLADGTILTLTQMQQATEGDDYLTFGDEGVSVDALGGNDTVISGNGNDTLRGGEGNDTLIAGLGDDVLYGEDGNDIVRGNEGNDILYGEAGDDLLQGGKGHDTLYSGSGTDILEGGEGNDTYVFARGDATNTIIDTAGDDILRFAEGINKEDILVKAVGKDIIIALAEVGKSFEELSDRVVMKNWLDTATRIENIVLSDGTSLNLSDISSATEGDDYLVFGDEGADISLLGGNDTLISGSGDDTIDGGAGDDTITTNGGADTVYGREGNDTIDTGDGHDSIDGGDGNDTIYAGKGNDTLTGGKGNDSLMGGHGDDTYIFNIGDGFDTLFDTEGNDTLQFGEGVTKDNLLLKQSGYDLLVTLKEDGKNFNELSDKVLIQNWFKGENNIEIFTFADGSKLLSKDIAALFVNVNIEDTLFSKPGALMRGEQGDDVYVYNRGDFKVIVDDYATKDDIEINAGQDMLQFSSGITKDDVKIGVNGNNLIIEVTGSHDTYEQLKDYVVVKDWKNENRGIEKIVFSDGEVLEITKTETFESVTFDNSWTSNRYYVYGSENNTITGSAYADKIEAGGGDDTINAGAGNDTIYGDAGDDNIDGGAGNDTFIGGAGADYLRDSAGDDTYVYTSGDGRDIIYDTSGNDTLRFAEGITKDDIIIKQYGNTMVVGLKEGDTSFYRLSDKITIRDWQIAGSRIETFAFSDGSTMGIDEIVSAIGTDKNDTIYGVDNHNDTLIGGKGDDTLIGGAGNDTYLFNRGDGKDTVIDSAGLDTIKFGIDINAQDVVFERVDNNLVVALAEDEKSFVELKDTITVKDWYTSLANRVEFVEFFNGTKLVVADEIMNGTEEADNLTFGAEDNVINALGGDDIIYAGAGNDTINGGDGNDNLQGQDGDDTISGDAGNDTLYGQDGNDILDGGVGNDTLIGSTGNDVYIFNRGDGKDTINEYGSTGSYNGTLGDDTLKFGEGISSDDILIKQDGDNLIVAIKEEGKTFAELSDKITANRWFSQDYYYYNYSYTNYSKFNRIENIEFSDGTKWNTSEIVAHTGTDENDSIYGLESTIADTLHGAKGNDSLYGKGGNDTYLFNRGDGKDTIYDYFTNGNNSQINAGNDTLKFGDRIAEDDLIIKKSGNNVVIGIKEDGKTFEELSDIVTITNWYNVNNKVENFVLNDGTAIDIAFLYEPTEEADNLTYGAEDNVINALGGDDIIYAGAGNDTINGGDGNDNLQGQDGDDTISGDAGNDTLYGQDGNDILDGGAGNDTLYGGKNNDTYLFGRGDGIDTIIEETASNGGGIDTLRFKEGITAYDIIIKQMRNNDSYELGVDLVIAIKEDGKTFAELSDKITIQNGAYYYENGYDYTNYNYYDYRVENFIFADGTEWSFADIVAHTNSDENDTIHGFNGADTLTGGKGDDTLKGHRGDDTYIFNRGDGHDTIYDYGRSGSNYNYYNAGNDTLKFGEGITEDDLIIKKSGNDVVVGIKEDGKTFEELSDIVTITNWYNVNNKVENFVLNDGTAIDIAFLYEPTEEADNLTYGAEDNVINALGGDDIIYAGAGNDTINGGDGNDNLQGQDGNDILDGGVGNDTLYGGKNNDTYLFGRGDGADTIIEETAYNSGGIDTLRFKEGITAYDIIIKQARDIGYGVNGDFVIALKEEGKTFAELSDKVTIQNGAYYYEYYGRDYTYSTSYDYRVENFIFADGTEWNFADLVAHTNSDDNDAIHGFNGTDILSGGKGNDTLKGYQGNDTYIFKRGDGHDTIYDYGRNGSNYSYHNAGNDTLKFGEGITEDDLIIKKSGNNVVIGIKEDGKTFEELSDIVTITNWYNVNNKVENFVLNDGTAIDIAFLYEPTEEADNLTYGAEDNVINALGGDDVIYGGAGNDTINGGDGNDNLQGEDGDDIISGDAGNDTLYGQDGNDILDGGAGNDTLYGGKNNDTYLFGRGDGIDTIIEETASNGGGIDTLRFKEGITADDIIIKQVRDIGYGVSGDFVIALKEDGKTFAGLSDKVTIQNGAYYHEYYSYDYTNQSSYDYRVEKFEFADGTEWSFADLVAHTNSDDNDAIHGFNGTDILSGGKGNDTLKGYQGNDTYIFKRGDGHDTIYDYGRNGSNYSYHNAGNDTLKFGEGIDKSDVVFYMNGNNLVIDSKNSDQVIITNQNNDNNAIETIMLSDGSYLTNIDVQRIVTDLSIYAQENNLDISSAEAIRANSELVQLFNTSWKDAETSGTYTPPLVLDLNQNDQTSTALADSHAYFDYNGDGDREHTAWMESGDALLAMDLNGDGAITNGGELFGDFTKLQDGSFAQDGYAALAQYDSNSDNIIDKNDARFGELLLWRDDNRDGKSTSNELINVALSSITAIHLSRETGISFEAYMENGNIITNETLYEGYNNTTGIIRDVWFEYDNSDTITNNDTLIVTKPNDVLIGEDGDDTYKYKMGDGSITIDDQDTTQEGADKLVFGAGITKGQLIIKWEKGSDNIIIGVREHVEDDTPLSQLEDKILIKNWFNSTGLIETFTFADGTVVDRETVYDLMLDVRENGELTLKVLDEDTELVGGDYHDLLYGVSGSEVLEGKGGDDYLLGFEGDDLLDGGHGDDVLVGGKRDDTLIGGSGDDFYIYNKSDGRDTIIDSEGHDTLFFGDGITRKDVMFEVIGDDMKITFAYDAELASELRDSIVITNWQQNGFEIENLEFANGEIYTIPELIEKNTNHAPTTLFAESSYMLTDVSIQTGIVLARDIDGDTLNYTVSISPENGTLSINKYGIWTYTSNDKYKGLDSAVITIDDGNGLSTTKTLNFEVVITNVDPIVLEAQTDVILQDIREATGDVGATDEDGDVLTYSVTTAAEHGTVNVDETGAWTYSVEGTYIGTDSAIITVDDGQGGSVTKTLNFDAKVSAPSIDTVAFNLQEDNISTNNLNVYNPVGGALTYEIIATSENGTFTLDENGEYSYNPSQNYNGLDAVIVKVTNEYGLNTTSTLTFDIEAVNDAPIVLVESETFTLTNIRDIDGKIEASDVDGDTLTYIVTTQAEHGVVTIDNEGNWHYKADPTYNGKNSAAITVDDGNGGAITSTLNFTRQGYIYEGEALVIDDNGQDALVMDNIEKQDLGFTKDANNLVINVKNQGSITLTDYFIKTDSGVATLQTSQGDINLSKDVIKTVVDGGWFSADKAEGNEGVKNLLVGVNDDANLIGKSHSDILFAGSDGDDLKGYAGNDLLIGGNDWDKLYGGLGDDNLYGQAGDDRLYGEEGNDVLVAGFGNDTLYGGEGNDFLSGGVGNDVLEGGLGNDIYFFGKGDGNDTIADSEPSKSFLWFNYNTQDGGNDTIKFDQGIAKEDISFYMKNNDLILQYSDNDSITIKNQNNKNAQIEKLELSDGNYLTNDDIDLVIQQISAYGKDNGMWHIDNKTIQANNDLMNIVSSAWQA